MIRLFAIIFFYFLTTLAVYAAELRIENWRGHQVLRLTGMIETGTADQFAALISSTPSLQHGVPILLLDSPGGLVEEALKMSRMMDIHPFHTVIPDGARCASACGSILFIAGIYRTVEAFGLLGQHSCYSEWGPDQACNKRLTEHAVRHGVSAGSVESFVTYIPPKDMLWFSRQDADGWGLTHYPGEREGGFEKSEPRVFRMLSGQKPAAQSAWRLDFREDGFMAFSRTVSDDEREMQINLFCVENLRGRLFLGMEINGPAPVVLDALLSLRAETDRFSWSDLKPVIWQLDSEVTEVITEVPRSHIREFLSKADALEFSLYMKKPYNPIIAQTWLSKSRKVLRFAANHCSSGDFVGPKTPVQ